MKELGWGNMGTISFYGGKFFNISTVIKDCKSGMHWWLFNHKVK